MLSSRGRASFVGICRYPCRKGGRKCSPQSFVSWAGRFAGDLWGPKSRLTCDGLERILSSHWGNIELNRQRNFQLTGLKTPLNRSWANGAISISHKRIIFLHISMVEKGGCSSPRGKAAPLADSQAERHSLEAQRLRCGHWDNEP